jgi:hypothetical protein
MMLQCGDESPFLVILCEAKHQVAMYTVELRGPSPLCHSERSEESRPSTPKYHLS